MDRFQPPLLFRVKVKSISDNYYLVLVGLVLVGLVGVLTLAAMTLSGLEISDKKDISSLTTFFGGDASFDFSIFLSISSIALKNAKTESGSSDS